MRQTLDSVLGQTLAGPMGDRGRRLDRRHAAHSRGVRGGITTGSRSSGRTRPSGRRPRRDRRILRRLRRHRIPAITTSCASSTWTCACRPLLRDPHGAHAQDPRIATCSGKAYVEEDGQWCNERHGDDTSLGMTKFYRVDCFEAIGGFVREVMWDGIDCHRCRMHGWIACSWDEPELRFVHLRPMGSSQQGIYTGRMRHGFGQYFMGTGFLFMLASALSRVNQKPYVTGSLAMLWGWIDSALRRKPRYAMPSFVLPAALPAPGTAGGQGSRDRRAGPQTRIRELRAQGHVRYCRHRGTAWPGEQRSAEVHGGCHVSPRAGWRGVLEVRSRCPWTGGHAGTSQVVDPGPV
jgi:hypothetical protein